MTSDHFDPRVLLQLVRVTDKEASYLARTASRLQAQAIDLAWVISSCGSYWGPILKKIGTQLDNLLRAEKLGWIDSTQTWIELRELRNRLVHEYMESRQDLLDAFKQALQSTDVLLETQRRMASSANALLSDYDAAKS